MAAVLDKKVIDKLRVNLKELLNQAKLEDRIKVARRFYYKSATEHKIDDDVSDGDCEAFLASLEEKPSPSTSYVVVNLPAPEISVATVKSARNGHWHRPKTVLHGRRRPSGGQGHVRKPTGHTECYCQSS